MRKYILIGLMCFGVGLVCLDHYVVNKYLEQFEAQRVVAATEATQTQTQTAMTIASGATRRVVKLEDAIDVYKEQVILLKDDNIRTLQSLETATEQLKEIIADNAKLQTELDSNAKATEELATKLSEARQKLIEYEKAGIKLNFLTRLFKLW